MNIVDFVLLAGVALAALAGFRLGFVTRVLSWIGLVAGVLLAVLVLGPLLEAMDPTNHLRLTIVAIAVVFFGAFAGQAVGFLIGSRLRPPVEDTGLNRIDAVLGLAAGVVGAVFMVWLLVPVLTQRPGPVAREVSASWIARQLDDHFPQPPDALQALRSFVGEDNFPDVFAGLEPSPQVGPPPASSGLSVETANAVAASIVKVEGIACQRIQDGTGFVVDDGLVVTNAHVVAGESSTDLVRDDGTRVPAEVVLFDPDRDLALLQAPRLNRPPLPIGTSQIGERGGVFGHPQGRALRVAPFDVARIIDATGRNIYGTNLVRREVVEIAADLEPGDSGSPLVNPNGQVVGVTFAIARDRPSLAYALSTNELRAVLAAPRAPVSTGACVRS